MVAPRPKIDVSDMPELLAVAREVQESGTPRILEVDGEPVAEIKPVRRRSRLPRGKRTGPNDPFWDIAGMASSGKRDRGSERVDEILAEFEVGKRE